MVYFERNDNTGVPYLLKAVSAFSNVPYYMSLEPYVNILCVVDVLKGKRVLVTGSSTGIGEQIAYHYARMGANVMVTSRRENTLKQVSCLYRIIGDIVIDFSM